MEFTIVETSRELVELCNKLATVGSFALDTEFVRDRTFFIQLGIVQVASDGVEAIIDPQAVESLEPLYALLQDASIEKIVHAGEQDFAALYEGSGVVPKNVFDSQIVAALVGYGDQISYAKLVGRVTGVQLSKLETLSNWTARPLTAAQIEYSIEDVRYLVQIRAHLVERLVELGRAGWEREECVRLEKEDIYRLIPPEEYYMRLKKGGLTGESLGALQAVAAWREKIARKRNLPRGWILRDQTIVEIARRKPSSLKSLKQIRSLEPSQIEKHGAQIIKSVQKGIVGPIELVPQNREKLKEPPQIESIVRLLEAWLYACSVQVKIAPSMLATRGELRRLAVGYYNSKIPELDVLKGWRRNLVGKDLLDLLDGVNELRIQDCKIVTKTH